MHSRERNIFNLSTQILFICAKKIIVQLKFNFEMISLNLRNCVLSIFLVLFTTYIIIGINIEVARATSLPSTTTEQNTESRAAKTFQNGFCGNNPSSNSTEYVSEYVLPQICEMP